MGGGGEVRGLREPFLVEAATGDAPAGRAAPALAWDEEGITGTEAPAGAELLDAAHALTMPGLVCAHLEPARAIFAGFPSRPGARLPEESLERGELAAAARLCALEAALAGVTLVYAFHRAPFFEGVLDVIGGAFTEVGIRVTAAVDVDERLHGADAARAAVAENVRFARAAAQDGRGMTAAMMGLSSPEGAPGILAEVVSEARRAEMGFHLVLRDPPGARRRIAEKGALRSGSVAVIAAPLDEEERALLRDLQVFPVITPRADLARAATPFALRGLSRHAVYGGFGGDADVLAERDTFLASRVQEPPTERISSWRPIANAWDLAAETLDRTFGRWSAGAPADLVVLDAPLPIPLSPATIASHFESVRARHVRHVVVGGRVVVREGALVTADARAIRAQARAAATSAWARASRREGGPN